MAILLIITLSTCLLIPSSVQKSVGNGETSVGQAVVKGTAIAEVLKYMAESETKAEQRQRWFVDWFGWGSDKKDEEKDGIVDSGTVMVELLKDMAEEKLAETEKELESLKLKLLNEEIANLLKSQVCVLHITLYPFLGLRI